MTLSPNTLPIAAGTAGISNPLWMDLLSSSWQIGIGGLGALVLILTAWNKILDIKQKRRDLRK